MNTILSGQNLVDTLREQCEQAKERIWIASPYIGNFKDVQKIIGGNWMRSHVDFRVLTDVESGFIRRDTYAQFKESPNTEVRSLLSLHAKIYLIDDWCLLTSANLTGMAFSARHEVGQVVSGIEQVVTLFDQWW
ncbi:MAG: phospholipase D family protein [Porphyromonas endodontalis]